MTPMQEVVMVMAAVAATVLTRFIAFIVFRPNKPTPPYVQYLGKVLPASVFAMLVVYCLRDLSYSGDANGLLWGLPADTLAQFCGIAVTVLVHLWRKNLMLSIAAGTACYMLMV